MTENKIILDLCGGTGSWGRPYRDADYDVQLITLLSYDVTRVEFRDYSMVFEKVDGYRWEELTILYSDVYGILAAPPCTEFSLAKGSRPRDFAAGVEVLQACLNIIWRCRIHGKPHFTFEQWQYGDMQIKPTDIWGYFKEPKPTVKERPESLQVMTKGGHSNGRGKTEMSRRV
mgnify:CR=1 FL=1